MLCKIPPGDGVPGPVRTMKSLHSVFPEAVDVAEFADDHALLKRDVEVGAGFLAGLQVPAVHIGTVDDLDPLDVVLVGHGVGRVTADDDAHAALFAGRGVWHMLFGFPVRRLRLHELDFAAAAAHGTAAPRGHFEGESALSALIDFRSFHFVFLHFPVCCLRPAPAGRGPSVLYTPYAKSQDTAEKQAIGREFSQGE